MSQSDLQFVREWVKGSPNTTISEIVEKLGKDRGVKSSRTAIHRILHKLKLSYITPRPIPHKKTKRLIWNLKKSTAQN